MRLSKNFTQKEFACQGKNCCGGSAPMDREFIKKLQKLRDLIGPILVTSGFRCKTHNRAVGGAEKSYHCLGQASDIKSQTSPQSMALAAEHVGFKGIGIYENRIHIDDREEKARW